MELSKEQRISTENNRLRAIYSDLPENALTLLDGLIYRAAYMRVTLEDYERDLDERGYTESFSQSERLDPYERERPVARLYNTMNKNYQSIIKQLSERLPESAPVDPGGDIRDFVRGG